MYHILWCIRSQQRWSLDSLGIGSQSWYSNMHRRLVGTTYIEGVLLLYYIYPGGWCETQIIGTSRHWSELWYHIYMYTPSDMTWKRIGPLVMDETDMKHKKNYVVRIWHTGRQTLVGIVMYGNGYQSSYHCSVSCGCQGKIWVRSTGPWCLTSGILLRSSFLFCILYFFTETWVSAFASLSLWLKTRIKSRL